MLMTREKRPAIRTLRGWAIRVLLEAGAIRECEGHGWMQDRADPHARERAFHSPRRDPPHGVSPQAASVAVADVLDSIGDTCPECPPKRESPEKCSPAIADSGPSHLSDHDLEKSWSPRTACLIE